MTTTNYSYRSYSMEYGTFVGLSWGLLFLCYVESISYNNGLLMMLSLLFVGTSLLLPFMLALRLNRKLLIIGERLSYTQGLFFSFSMFMYACLLTGLATFAYFQFFDDGTLFEQLNSMFTMPELVAVYQQMGMEEQYKQMLDVLKDIEGMSAFDKALGLFNNNFIFGIAMSFIVGWVASFDLKKVIKK